MRTRMSGNLQDYIKILTEAGIPEEDARFDISVIFSYLGQDEKVFDEAVKKRASGVPAAYVIGSKAFYKEEYKVTPDVLIPRADTELLVETALKFLGALPMPVGDVLMVPEKTSLSSLRVLDICTGTGCVGISVFNSLYEKYPDAECIISDISDKALKIAMYNVEHACVKPDHIKVIKADALQEDLPEGLGEFDVITGNPPYIDGSDMEVLDDEVRHEPVLALAGGEDGMRFYEPIAKMAQKHLKNGGMLAVEHGYNQGQLVAQTLVNTGFNNVKTLKDYGGNDRVTFGVK